MIHNDLDERSATEIARLVAAGEVNVDEVVEAALSRIDAREPSLHAWQFLDPEAVNAQARGAPRDGPLTGVVVGVKDNFDTHDMPTTYGSPIYAGNRPSHDAACVARLRKAGALVLGKTAMTQFAAVFEPAKTVNPYRSDRTPGGSSSGSAAAVADRMVPVAVGTQTAGSVIRPAAYCGVFGFKPTANAINRDGVKLISPSLDAVGMFARSVDDLAMLAEVLFQPPSDVEHHGSPKREANGPRLRVAFIRTDRWDQAESATRTAVEKSAGLIAGDGAEVEEIQLPPLFDELIDASIAIFHFELARMLETEYTQHLDMLPPSLVEAIEDGLRMKERDYRAHLETASRCRPMIKELFATHDVILTPATLGEAPSIQSTGDPLFCRSWSLLGNPTTTLPGLQGPSGLPVGIQLVGDVGADVALLAVADRIARLLPVLPAPSRDRKNAGGRI